LNLGEFSISLAVKDLKASREFYEKLGFEAVRQEQPDCSPHAYGERWLILRSGGATIGLFQGLFDKNVLTFNPTDVRAIQRVLKQRGVKLVSEADEKTEGPSAATLLDPDGNPILLDQHNP